MHIRPILSALRRHRIAAALIVLEVAITFAIVCNAVFMIAQRLERADEPSGIVEAELLRLQIAPIGPRNRNGERARTLQDLAVLRALPGVRGVTLSNQVPFGNSSSNSSVSLPGDPDRAVIAPSAYLVGEGFLATTGLKLVAGRDFTPDEYVDNGPPADGIPPPTAPAIILNRAAAERLFPGGQALGQQLLVHNGQSTVVGIVEELVRPRMKAPERNTMILPRRVTFSGGNYLLRVDPAQRDAVLKAAVAALEQAGPGRVVAAQQTLQSMRERYFKSDHQMALLLAAVCAALLVVTALGIVGLASFWVQQRTRMIGIRRALGATRGQIRGYFQLENLLLTGIGIGLGLVAAYAINHALMRDAGLPRLPPVYGLVAALSLWGLGQLAVLVPARRAAALPPVVIMRGA